MFNFRKEENMEKIKIDSEFIKLDSFLKWSGITTMGSEGKILISNGQIYVNGDIELRRGRKLIKGDVVTYDNHVYEIV